MDKVLSLIVAAAVLLMTAVTLIVMTSDSLGDFGESTSQVEDQSCEFEMRQIDRNPDRLDQVSPECEEEAEDRFLQASVANDAVEAILEDDGGG